LPLIPVTIEKYAPPGNGLGFFQGKAVFVSRAVVGDELLIRVEKEKKRYIIGSIAEIVKVGSRRRQVPCPHYEECGGCDLLQLNYQDQLALKKEMLSQSLAGAGFSLPVSVAAAPQEHFYRHRAVFHSGKALRAGFLRRRSHRVVAVPDCQVLAPGLKNLLSELNENPGLSAAGNNLYYALANRAGDYALTGSRGGSHSRNLHCVEGFAETICENYGYGEIELAASGFAQVNPQIVSLMIEDLLKNCSSADVAAELYGGSGTFSLPLAQVVGKLEVYESDFAAAARGRRNAERNRLDNVRFTGGRVEKIAFGKPLDLMVVDPPRVGLSALVAEKISASPVRKLVYISCNPATLARDLSRLNSHPHNFTLDSVKAYDMYPGTTHLEVMAVLCR